MRLRLCPTCFSACFLLSLLAAAVSAEDARPGLVPAQLFRTRDGLGNVLAKLKAGGEVRIAYFGGSITAQEGWRPKTLKWFAESFPKAKIREINATIGGTGSDLGVFRYGQDVLRHKPDLVFVEFAVNDSGAAPEAIHRAMEGIVRQTWRQDPAIDLCYVYTFVVGHEKDLDRGFCPRAASADEILADHYGIPSINVAMRVAELARDGKLSFKPADGEKADAPAGKILFSTDGVHPLDAGHEVYLQVIREAMAQIEPKSRPGAHAVKAPLRADNWEAAKLVPLDPSMLQGSWKRLDAAQGLGKTFGNRLPAVWEGSKPGDKITFKFKGTQARVYDLMGPDAGKVVCTVDGAVGRPISRFDSFCTYHRLASFTVADGLEEKEHAVTIEIQAEQPDRGSVVNRVRGEPGFDPKKYDGTNLRAGYLMLIGDLVPAS
ncbi:MAG: GDSL-type esterase/lipase family protein [Pirellulales bacterium]